MCAQIEIHIKIEKVFYWNYQERRINVISFISCRDGCVERNVLVDYYSLIDELSFYCRLEHTQKRRDRKWKARSPFGRTKIWRCAPAIRWVSVRICLSLLPSLHSFDRLSIYPVGRFLMVKSSSPVWKIDGPGDRKFSVNTCKKRERINGTDEVRSETMF